MNNAPLPSARRVVITGIGAVTPCGNTAADTWAALVAGRSGIGRITRFDPTGCTAQIAGEVKGFDPARALPAPLHPRGPAGDPLVQALTQKDLKKFGRFTHLGVGAAVEAYADAGLDAHRAALQPDRMGVNLGVGLGGLPEMEAMHDTWKAGGFRKISPFFIIQIAPNLLAGQVSLLLDFRGPNMSVASACATSGHAIGEAAAAIARGDADVMVAGGAESTVTPLAIGAFAQMRALSTRNDAPELSSRPYDQDRDGFVLAEGSVAFILEELGHAQQRGARIYAELCGYGASADAYHLSSLAPGAEGSARAMRAALARAGLAATDIDYVSAHATSTPGGDGEEAAAIAAVFAENKAHLHVSGVKSMTGHLLGGAGAMGLFAAVLAIRDGIVPPTINLANVDPACAATGLNFTPNVAVRKTVRAALANSFGFGGTNASWWSVAWHEPPWPTPDERSPAPGRRLGGGPARSGNASPRQGWAGLDPGWKGPAMHPRLIEAARDRGLSIPAGPLDDLAVGELASALYLRPARTRRSPREEGYLAAARRRELPSPVGPLAAWTWGEAGHPLVVLVHGWEGRGSQLGALAAPLVAAGFCVVAFDGPGHGESPGEEASVPLFAQVIAGLPATLGPVHAVAGHSLGAAGAGLATTLGLAVRGLVFFAPPLWQKGRLAYAAERMQLSPVARQAFYAGVERRTAWPLERADMRVVARAAPCPLVVFHDPGDADTDYAGSAELVGLWPGARLVPCPGRGHNRILTTPGVIAEAVRFVAGLK